MKHTMQKLPVGKSGMLLWLEGDYEIKSNRESGLQSILKIAVAFKGKELWLEHSIQED